MYNWNYVSRYGQITSNTVAYKDQYRQDKGLGTELPSGYKFKLHYTYFSSLSLQLTQLEALLTCINQEVDGLTKPLFIFIGTKTD